MSVPVGLPPTEGPCLKCGKTIVSPKTTEATTSEKKQTDSSAAIEPPIRRRNRRKGGGSDRRQINPIAFWGVTTVALILGFIGLLYIFDKSASKSDKSASKEPTRQIPTIPREEGKKIKEPWEDKALSILKSFLEAETAEERMQYIQGSEMFTAQLESGLDLDKLALSGFFPNEVQERDKARGIFGFSYQMPSTRNFSSMFPPVPTLRDSMSPLEELSLNVRSTANLDQFMADEVMISAYFKDGEEGMKLDWPVFAQSLYGLLDSFAIGEHEKAQEIFRVGVFQDKIWPHLDPSDALSVYRIGEVSELAESYRVMIYDEKVNSMLEEKFSNTDIPLHGATVLVERRGTELILKNIVCWEFLGLGGE